MSDLHEITQLTSHRLKITNPGLPAFCVCLVEVKCPESRGQVLSYCSVESSISGIMSQDVLILKEQREEKDEILKKNPRMSVVYSMLTMIGPYQSRRAELQHSLNRVVCLEAVSRLIEKRDSGS